MERHKGWESSNKLRNHSELDQVLSLNSGEVAIPLPLVLEGGCFEKEDSNIFSKTSSSLLREPSCWPACAAALLPWPLSLKDKESETSVRNRKMVEESPCAKAKVLLILPPAHNLVKPVEGSRADEENVGCVNLGKIFSLILARTT